jgi:hypothetical protein
MQKVLDHFESIQKIPDIDNVIDYGRVSHISRSHKKNNMSFTSTANLVGSKPKQIFDYYGEFIWQIDDQLDSLDNFMLSKDKNTFLFKEHSVPEPKKFTDEQFKPKMTSLFNDGIGKFKEDTSKDLSAEIEWRRIQDCYSKTEITIAENVKPGDVSQGQIGDCYFMATLSALAAFHPQIISDMFITKEFNEAGIYAMKVYVNGHRQVVVVDDYIPYYKRLRAPAFAKKETLNIWPILIEKAWAKV